MAHEGMVQNDILKGTGRQAVATSRAAMKSVESLFQVPVSVRLGQRTVTGRFGNCNLILGKSWTAESIFANAPFQCHFAFTVRAS